MLVMVYLLVIILFIGYIDLLVAFGFLMTYAIYVTLVFFQSKIIGPDDVRAPRKAEVSTSNNKTPVPS
jgi:hypothetical protein